MAEDYTYKNYFEDLYRSYPGNRLKLLLMLALRIASGSLTFLAVYLTGRIVDFFINYEQGQVLTEFHWLVGGIFVVGVVKVITRFYSKFFIQKAGMETQKHLRMRGFTKLLELDLFWHEKENTGNKVQRVQSGSKSSHDFARLLSNELAAFLIDFVGAIIIFFFVGWKYVMFMLLFAAIYIAVEKYYENKLYKRSKDLHKKQETLSGKAHEAASNIMTIKSLGLHKRFKNSMHSHERQYEQLWEKHKVTSQNKMKAVNVLITLGHAIFFLIVGYDVVAQAITVGRIVVFTGYYTRFANGISKYSNISLNLIQFKVKMQRLQEILQLHEKPFDKQGKKNVPRGWKELRFDKVRFRYDQKDILQGLDLTIRRNEKVGIVGGSGAGKSTLIKLLLRLYEPTNGAIRIGGRNLLDIKRYNLRNEVTVVSQDQEVFNMTLRENITLSQNGVDKKRLDYAIRASGLSKVIRKLPQGLLTIIGEKGYKLSGGERQRVSIARALYRNASVIILDEATSHLDTRTERSIQDAIDRIEGKTIIIIAHRLSTLENVDRIVYMEHGRVKEQGTFRKLMEKRDRFYKLLQKQKLQVET
ncbi:MAG: ABC transporter ATP-binding protein [Candidatus Woesearchaeota archaeon]